MNRVKDELLAILDSGNDTGALIDQVQQAVRHYGTPVYPELLGILTSLELEKLEAFAHWRRIVENWRDLEDKLGRDVSLQTAACDYFSSLQGALKAPRVNDHIYEKSVRDAYLDKLTGLYNRQYSDEILARELALAKRHSHELSLLLLDIDDFKGINGGFGRGVGDLYLQLVSGIIHNSKRVEDIACRYGGEEILLILPNTGGQEAMTLGRRILGRVENATLNYLGKPVVATLSAGLATYPRYGETAAELLQSCDTALRRAKGNGKNALAAAEADKRHCPRVSISQPIRVRSFGRINGNEAISALCRDISLGGFSFRSDTRLEKGSLVEVQFPLPHQDPVTLIGEVVRVDDAPHGTEVGAELCFKRMDKSCQRAISNYIAGHGRA